MKKRLEKGDVVLIGPDGAKNIYRLNSITENGDKYLFVDPYSGNTVSLTENETDQYRESNFMKMLVRMPRSRFRSLDETWIEL